jgi:hypothetical protein
MGSAGDLKVSADCEDNQDLYRAQVDLEILSSFSFQQGHWLGDVRPALLTQQQQRGLAEAKRRADLREAAEKRIPKHLLYVKGCPLCMPTRAESRLLANVRCLVADTLHLVIDYREPDTVLTRYAQLIEAHASKQGIQIPPVIQPRHTQALPLWAESEMSA